MLLWIGEAVKIKTSGWVGGGMSQIADAMEGGNFFSSLIPRFPVMSFKLSSISLIFLAMVLSVVCGTNDTEVILISFLSSSSLFFLSSLSGFLSCSLFSLSLQSSLHHLCSV